MRPLKVQVIAYAPTVFYHCQHWELTFRETGIGDRIRQEEAAQALPDDLRREYGDVDGMLRGLVPLYDDEIRAVPSLERAGAALMT